MGAVARAVPDWERLDERLGPILVGLLMVLYPVHFYLSWPARLNASVGDLLIAVVGPLWLLGLLGRRRIPRFSVHLLTFVAVVVVATTIALVAGAPYVRFEHTVLEFGKLLGAIAWFLGTYAVLVDDAVRRLRVLALVSTLLAVVFAAGTIADGVFGSVVRPTGPFENPNIYANYLVVNGFLAAYLVGTLRRERPRLAIAASLAIPTLAAALLVTGSRGGLLGAATGVAALVLVHPNVDHRLAARPLFVVAAVLSTIALVAVLSIDDRVRERLATSLEPESDNVGGRLERWDLGVDAVLEHPLTGVGFGQSQNYVRSRGVNNPYPRLHNTHLTVLTETGVLGLAALYVLFGGVVYQAGRLARRIDAAYAFLGAAIFATFGQGLVTGVLTFRSLWIVTGSIAALSAHHDGEGPTFDAVPAILARRWDAVTEFVARRRS